MAPAPQGSAQLSAAPSTPAQGSPGPTGCQQQLRHGGRGWHRLGPRLPAAPWCGREPSLARRGRGRLPGTDASCHCKEMNTKERYKASAHIHVNVLDGDDQYPQFLPCRALLPATASVCLSPIYTANITAGRAQVSAGVGVTSLTPSPCNLRGWGQAGGLTCPPLFQVRPLHFLPGAIHAEDGDHGLKAAITYSLLPGTKRVAGAPCLAWPGGQRDPGTCIHVHRHTCAATCACTDPRKQSCTQAHMCSKHMCCCVCRHMHMNPVVKADTRIRGPQAHACAHTGNFLEAHVHMCMQACTPMQRHACGQACAACHVQLSTAVGISGDRTGARAPWAVPGHV